MTKVIPRGLLLVSAPFTLRIFLPESAFSKLRNSSKVSRFPVLGRKAAGYGLPTTVVYTEGPEACMPKDSKLQHGVKLLNLPRLPRGPPLSAILGSHACTRGVSGFT